MRSDGMTVPSYTDSQTGYVYKLIVDEVLRNVRRDMREEVDDHNIMVLKQNWERKLTNVITRSRNSVLYNTMAPEKPPTVSQSSSTYSFNNYPKPEKMSNVFPKLSSPTTDSHKPVTSILPAPPLPVPVRRPSAPQAKFTPEKRKVQIESLLETKKIQEANPVDSRQEKNRAQKKPRINRFVQLDGGVDDLTDTEEEDVYSDQDPAKETEEQKRFKLDNDFVEIDGEGNLMLFNQTEDESRVDEPVVDTEPLNPDDDISDEDTCANNTQNVMVCRFEKLVRRKAHWRVDFRSGVASILGVDLVFNKAVSDLNF